MILVMAFLFLAVVGLVAWITVKYPLNLADWTNPDGIKIKHAWDATMSQTSASWRIDHRDKNARELLVAQLDANRATA